MVINTNLPAQMASSRLGESSALLAKSLQRLSSGSRITSPADDSAGLAVSTRLSAQLSRLDATAKNIGNAISFVQTQDGYLQKFTDMLTRMSELAVLSMDTTKSAADRADYDTEYQALGVDLIDQGTVNFNGVPLFGGKDMQVTVDPEANTFDMKGIDAASITYVAGHDSLLQLGDAMLSLGYLKDTLNTVAKYRAQVGAAEQQLAFHADQMATLKTNLTAANSRITDVDVAQESTNYARYNILVQAGTAMLAQANSLPQSVLKLLGLFFLLVSKAFISI